MKYMAPETNKLKMCTHLMPQYQITRKSLFYLKWTHNLLTFSPLRHIQICGRYIGYTWSRPLSKSNVRAKLKDARVTFLRNREMFHSNPYCIFTRLYIHASKSMNRIRARPTCDYMSFIHYGNCIPTVIRERRGGGGLHQRECPN